MNALKVLNPRDIDLHERWAFPSCIVSGYILSDL